MRLFVMGANGRTGREIVGIARSRGHKAVAAFMVDVVDQQLHLEVVGLAPGLAVAS